MNGDSFFLDEVEGSVLAPRLPEGFLDLDAVQVGVHLPDLRRLGFQSPRKSLAFSTPGGHCIRSLSHDFAQKSGERRGSTEYEILELKSDDLSKKMLKKRLRTDHQK